MERFVGPTFEDVYDREPAVFVELGELELLAVETAIGGRSYLFNCFNGYCQKNDKNALEEVLKRILRTDSRLVRFVKDMSLIWIKLKHKGLLSLRRHFRHWDSPVQYSRNRDIGHGRLSRFRSGRG